MGGHASAARWNRQRETGAERVCLPVARRYVQHMRSLGKLRDAEWWAATLAPLRGKAAAAAAAAAFARAAAPGASVQQVSHWAPRSTHVGINLAAELGAVL